MQSDAKKEIAKQIVEQKGHYCLAVKINQAILYREIKGKRSCETRYYILDQNMTSEEMSHIVRGHWEIENHLHWVLDVHFREDACKVKLEKAMQNLALIRKICYNLMKLLFQRIEL